VHELSRGLDRQGCFEGAYLLGARLWSLSTPRDESVASYKDLRKLSSSLHPGLQRKQYCQGAWSADRRCWHSQSHVIAFSRRGKRHFLCSLHTHTRTSLWCAEPLLGRLMLPKHQRIPERSLIQLRHSIPWTGHCFMVMKQQYWFAD
jgi:hypothetical protein